MADLDILIPHFNDPEGLALTLRSIARQESWGGSARIVIADDGSRPEDKAAVEKLCGNSDLNIDLLYNKINRGRPYTRNVLLDAMDSPYAAWLDAGDEWYPKKLSVQFGKLAQVESTNLGRPYWITCHYDWAWLSKRKKKTEQRTKQDQARALLMGRSLRAYLWTLLGPATAFRSVGWFDEQLPRLQDLDFFLRFVLHGGYIYSPKTSNPLCVYHKSDIGRDAAEINACNKRIFAKYRVLYNRYGSKFRRMRLFNMELLSARFAQNNNDMVTKRYFMKEAGKVHPLALLWLLVRQRGRL